MAEPREDFDPDVFIETLLHFEYRKALRRFGGSLLNPNRYALLPVGVVILWLLNFFIYAVRIVPGELTISFERMTAEEDVYANFTAGAWVQLISFVYIVTAINWNVGDCVWWFWCTLLLTTLLQLLFRLSMEKSQMAMAIVQYATTCVLGTILANYIWQYDFVPRFIRWRYGKMKMAGRDRSIQILASFPLGACIRFALYILLCLPIWIPLAIILGLVGALHCVGAPFEELFPLRVLFRMEPAFWVLKVEEFRVRDIPNERIELRVKITYAQRQSLNLVRSRPLFFIFNGEVDHNFLPNGIGQWRDSDKNGEFLNGHWKHGLPEAPFQSREYRLGGIFKAVQIGAIMCSDAPVDTVQSWPNFLPKNVYAVASAECCVSEQFYAGFPAIRYLYGKPGGKDPTGLQLPQIHSIMRTRQDLEVVLFIPGFNSCLDNAVSTFALFLTLAGYPEHFMPWVIEWPGSSVLTYFRARSDSESSVLHSNLLQFFEDLKQSAVTRVNIIGHSMGARVLISFLSAHYSVFSQPEGLRLGAVLLVNPEADLKYFIETSSIIESIAESITVYADRNDEALYWAELANTCFPTPFCAQEKFSHSLGRATLPLRRPMLPPPTSCTETDQEGADQENGLTPRPSLRTYGSVDDEIESGSVLLDIDFVDTSSIKANVKTLRHSYFHISREVLEDTREILVSRSRADLRKSRLVRREGNVYGWLQAPSFFSG